jgi:hypothetical protein
MRCPRRFNATRGSPHGTGLLQGNKMYEKHYGQKLEVGISSSNHAASSRVSLVG